MLKKVTELIPHPKNAEIYLPPGGPEWEDFVASIKQHGVLEALQITPNNVILSGHRRWQAAKLLGIDEIECSVITPVDEADELFKLIEFNRYRKKRTEEIMREAAILESLEAKLNLTGGHKGFGWNAAGPGGRSKERIAQALGIGSYVTYDRLKKVFAAAETIPAIKDALREMDEGKKSLNAVWMMTQRALYPSAEGPGFDLKIYNVWYFSDCDPALGMEHPGRIPGQVVQNLLWYYTEEGDLVVDPFAGGGITVDACALANRQCLALDIAPVRDDITQWNIANGYPPEAAGAKLVFADPPYWNMLEDEYKALSKDTAAALSYSEFCEFLEKFISDTYSILAPGGYLALIIMLQFMKLPPGLDDAYIDWPILVWQWMKKHGFRMVNRITEQWPTSIYNPSQVLYAKEHKTMLTIYGNIVIGQKP